MTLVDGRSRESASSGERRRTGVDLLGHDYVVWRQSRGRLRPWIFVQTRKQPNGSSDEDSRPADRVRPTTKQKPARLTSSVRVMTPGVSLEALEALYRTRAAAFFRFAVAKTGDPERARDAVQDGFAQAIRRRGTFRGTGSLEAWVARCVINAAHDLNRAISRTTEPDDVVADPVIESDAGAAVVREAVQRLPMRQRDALFLRYYLDLDYRAIADVLDVEVGTVSSTLHTARNSLRDALQEVPR